MLVTIAIIYRGQIYNGFSFISGDSYDYVISSSILEHWFNFFRGYSGWSETNYYYPYKNTIAQTDAYFLISIFYSIIRFLGIEPYLSSELSGGVLKIVGFLSLYVFLIKVLKTEFYLALLGGALFTLSNAMVSHSSRLQLATVALAPIATYLFYKTLYSLYFGNNKHVRVYGCFLGIIYGGWCLTCFYMAWFWTYFNLVFLFLVLIFNLRFSLNFFVKVVSDKNRLISLFLVFSVSFLALLPFIHAFYPKSHEVGLRTYDMVVKNTVNFYDIIQLGTDNYIFGHFYNQLIKLIAPGYIISGEYYNTGVTPILFILFVFSFFYFFRRMNDGFFNRIIFLFFLSICITWVSLINLFGHSLWFFVYTFVPGAKALNAISTYQIFLAFPVIVIVLTFLSSIKIKKNYIILIIAFSLIAELSRQHLNFNRLDEVKKVSINLTDLPNCQAFYILAWESKEASNKNFPDWVNNMYAHNVTAMMVAEKIHLPTINGIASFNMPDWNFASPELSDYRERVYKYANAHGIKSLCSYNPNTKELKLDLSMGE
jgi:hypothetical protein